MRSLQRLKQAAKRRLLNSVKEGESKEKETLLCRGQQSTTVESMQRGKSTEQKAGAEIPHQMLGCGRKAIIFWQYLGSDTGQCQLSAQTKWCSSTAQLGDHCPASHHGLWGRCPQGGGSLPSQNFPIHFACVTWKAFSWLWKGEDGAFSYRLFSQRGVGNGRSNCIRHLYPGSPKVTLPCLFPSFSLLG